MRRAWRTRPKRGSGKRSGDITVVGQGWGPSRFSHHSPGEDEEVADVQALSQAAVLPGARG